MCNLKTFDSFGITTKFQQLTMETLFGRFPHLVEDIFGLLDGKTLFCCSQINNPWKENLKEYRFHLVKKIQKLLKNQSIVYGPVKNSLNRAVRRSESASIIWWA